jgi:amidase
MVADEVWSWDAAATAAAIRARVISSREAVAASLARLHSVNPQINAVVEILEEEALAAADAADRALASGGACGALHGVPVTTKINVDLAGHATTNGLVAMRDAIAAEDSSPVANLRRAGAIVIGRTNVPAFSYRWFTGNDLHGVTHNPWGPRLSPGGSSGGAGASLAAGIATLAHGNDVAGSLRLPAGACGVYGMRPTVGRLPSYNPSSPVEKSLCLQIGGVEGAFARSVRDLRLALAALEAPDPRDPWQNPPPQLRDDLHQPCRVAIVAGEAEFAAAPEIAALVRQAGSWLSDAGYIVEEVAPPRMAEIAELWMAMLYAESSGPAREAMFALADEAFRRSFTDTAAILPVLDPPAMQHAWERRLTIQRQWSVFLETYPVILTPTSCQPTFPIDHDLKGKETLAEIAKALSPLSSVAGLALPAISAPVGLAAGAPAGVQIVCGRFMEERCLAVAAVLEERIGRLRPIDPVGA